MTLNLVPPSAPVAQTVALYDPKGVSSKQFRKWNIPFKMVKSLREASGFRTLVIGREALSGDGDLPDLSPVKSGLNTLILEQNAKALERLGFRTNEHGLRKLFFRSPGHPVLTGLPESVMRDWRGEATLLPPYLSYLQFFCPPRMWCGFKTHIVWRAGNRGTIANVLIEKPTSGNFKPILDGGFALQYSPLLEYREGTGRILFCQLEICGRTGDEPAAENLLKNMLGYLETAQPISAAKFAAAGGAGWKDFLRELRLKHEVSDFNSADVLLIGPGAESYSDLTKFAEKGGKLLLFGLDAKILRTVLPGIVPTLKKDAVSERLEKDCPELDAISDLDAFFQTRTDFVAADNREIRVLPVGKGSAVVVGVTPQMLDCSRYFRLRSSWRRRAFLTAQLIRNSGIASDSVLLERFMKRPMERPWEKSFYLQTPEIQDDPYRYYHW